MSSLTDELTDAISGARPLIEQAKATLASRPPWYDVPDEGYCNGVLFDLRMCVQRTGPALGQGSTFWSEWDNAGTRTACEFPQRFRVETRRQHTGSFYYARALGPHPVESYEYSLDTMPQTFHDHQFKQRMLTLRGIERIVRDAGLKPVIYADADLVKLDIEL